MALDARALLDAAIEEARRSWDEGGVPIGAVLAAPDGAIVARGHNERLQKNDPTAHAEMVCIRRAGRRRDWRTLTLVTTLSPCSMCAGTAALFKIPRVIAGESRSFPGAEAWLREQGVAVDVLDDPRCLEIMRRLQQERPELWAEDIGE